MPSTPSAFGGKFKTFRKFSNKSHFKLLLGKIQRNTVIPLLKCYKKFVNKFSVKLSSTRKTHLLWIFMIWLSNKIGALVSWGSNFWMGRFFPWSVLCVSTLYKTYLCFVSDRRKYKVISEPLNILIYFFSSWRRKGTKKLFC